MVLERLPGMDLGQAYETLSAGDKRNLAEGIAEEQQKVGWLGRNHSYGYFVSKEISLSGACETWSQVVEQDLARSEERLRKSKAFGCEYVSLVRKKMAGYQDYFRSIQPTPFLDDTTTKNVIVSKGKLSGIVDADEICFGDGLFVIGLTKMGLLSMGADTDYVEYWLDTINAGKLERKVIDFYALVFCVNFMGELGQTFNKKIEYEEKDAEKLKVIFDGLARKC